MHAHAGLAAASRMAERVMERRLMADTTKRDKRVKPGKALPRTDEQLDALAEITPADLDAALVEATPDMARLVEARPDEEHEP